MLVWVLVGFSSTFTRPSPKRMVDSADGFGADENVTGDFVFWVEIMAIARSADWLTDLICCRNDILKDVEKPLIIKLVVVDEPRIVLTRLDFDVFKEAHCFLKFLIALEHGVLEDRAIEAGAAKKEVLTFFGNLVIGDLRN